MNDWKLGERLDLQCDNRDSDNDFDSEMNLWRIRQTFVAFSRLRWSPALKRTSFRKCKFVMERMACKNSVETLFCCLWKSGQMQEVNTSSDMIRNFTHSVICGDVDKR